MANLADGADILTPNLTEASIILGTEYTGQNVSTEEVESMINMLRNRGAKNVIIKGVDREDGYLRNFVAGRTTPLTELIVEKLPVMLHGTGDLFCSCVTAAIMAEKDLVTAVDFAGKFVHDAMIVTLEQPNFMSRGISFEPLLGKIADLLK
jgi:pyridoxine kinase